MNNKNWLPEWLLQPLIQTCRDFQVWLVGGAIRNQLMGCETVDFDFVVENNARSLARKVANRLNGYYYELDEDRDTGRVILVGEDEKRLLLDFAHLRGESIEEDLKDRDFTINALAVHLTRLDEVLDPTGGLQDLKDKVLRLCNSDAIVADPIRGLRAIRMGIQFGVVIDSTTLNAVREGATRLSIISPERIRDEFFRILDLPFPGKAIRLMDHVGHLSEIFPQLEPLRGLTQSPPHEYSAWDHTLAVLDHLGKLISALGRHYDPEVASELTLGEIVYRLGRFREGINSHLERELSHGRKIRQLLFLGTLFHDAGKPACYESFEGRIRFHGHEQVGAEIIAEMAADLKMSNVEIKWLDLLVRNHLRPAQLERENKLTHRAIYRFLRHTNEASVSVLLLSLADLLGKQTPPMDQKVLSKRVEMVRQLLAANFEASSEKYNPEPLLRGDEIAEALHIEPGPEIGQLLLALQEAQVSGEVKSKSDAFDFIKSKHVKMMNSRIGGVEEEEIP